MAPNREFVKELIQQMKQIKSERELTSTEVHEMLLAAGEAISYTTVKRVFAPDSEDAGFRYKNTIQPMMRVLFALNEKTTEENLPNAAEIDALKNVVLLKEKMINDLSESNHLLEIAVQELTEAKNRLEKMLDEEISHHAECKINLVAFREQVNLLTTQIHRKDKVIDSLREQMGE